MPRARGDFLARWAAPKGSRAGGDDAGNEGERTRLLPDNGNEESYSVDDAQQEAAMLPPRGLRRPGRPS